MARRGLILAGSMRGLTVALAVGAAAPPSAPPGANGASASEQPPRAPAPDDGMSFAHQLAATPTDTTIAAMHAVRR